MYYKNNDVDLSPVVLFVYKRPHHTLKVLEALKQNEESPETHLFIFCDGAKSKEKSEDIALIKQVREIVRKENWCGKINIIEHKENLGLDPSILYGVNFVFEKYNKLIVLEDDNVPSRYFLKYMNDGLKKYEKICNVYQVSAYCYPIKGLASKSYLLPYISSWGWGTWKNKWKIFRFDKESFKVIGTNRFIKSRFNLSDLDYYSNFLDPKADHWDVYFYYEVFKRNGMSLFPGKSLIHNIGLDGTGENCNIDMGHLSETSFSNEIEVVEEDLIDLEVLSQLNKFFQSKRRIDKTIRKLEDFKNSKSNLFSLWRRVTAWKN